MRRGWCPTVFAPMPSGDGLLVRVRPPGGRLQPAQARALAHAAARYGNGVIELTSRGNLQLRGLSPAGTEPFAAAMIAAGLALADPVLERLRAVALAPLSDAATRRVAADLDGLLADPTLAGLPPKFGFAVGLPWIGADVCLHPVGAGWRVWPDGATRAAESDEPAADALRLARAFLAVAPAARRLRQADARAVFAAAGLCATAAVPAPPRPCVIGPLPGGFGVGLAFGTTDAATLAALAACGPLHVSPWRALVIAMSRPPSSAILALFARHGLIVDPADPRPGVAACAGRPACAAAEADVRADAIRLAQLYPAVKLHVSGCTKGCAHPHPAAVTLVAGADGYALVRHGTAADPPLHTGLTFAEAAAMIAP